MIAVIFEVCLKRGCERQYLDLATGLRSQLEQIDGFISVERFQSLTVADKILSLSFFRDEEAIAEWRNKKIHRTAQEKGRGGVFEDYRLRVASVIRDYGKRERDQAPSDSCEAHDRQKPC